MLKFMYVVFLGVLLAVFVGMGTAVFYKEPPSPQYPSGLDRPLGPDGTFTAEQQREESAYQQRVNEHSDEVAVYNRNVAIILLAAAVVLLAVGLALHARAGVLADGMLLGGVLTLLYSIIRSFGADDVAYSFVITGVGLAATLTLGYLKFIKPQPDSGAGKGKNK